METSDVVTQILDSISGAVVEKARFGRSELTLFWVDAGKLLRCASELRTQGGFDLENLSAMQVDESLAFTYFLRNPENGDRAVIRATRECKSADDWISHESMASVWPMAKPYEAEISRLFGVRIDGCEAAKEWDGFPLRKSFVVTGGISP